MNATRITRPEARVIAEEEWVRFADAAASLTPEEWTRPTECTAWNVRQLVLHVLGSGYAQASVRQFVRQLRKGLPLNKDIDSHHWVDGMNEFQTRERAHLSNEQHRGAAASDRTQGGTGSLAHASAGPLPTHAFRSADRMGAPKVPARRRFHP